MVDLIEEQLDIKYMGYEPRDVFIDKLLCTAVRRRAKKWSVEYDKQKQEKQKRAKNRKQMPRGWERRRANRERRQRQMDHLATQEHNTTNRSEQK